MDACSLRVMTFNVRGSFHEGDGINAWNNRAALNVETLKRQAPHVIGFQEVQSGNLVTCKERIPEYGRVLGTRAGDKAPSPRIQCDLLRSGAARAARLGRILAQHGARQVFLELASA